MAEDFDDHRRIFNRSDDLQTTAAVGAVVDIDVEDPFEQSGPAHARRFSLGRDVIGWWLGGALRRSGNDFTAQLGVGRQHAMGAFASCCIGRRALIDHHFVRFGFAYVLLPSGVFKPIAYNTPLTTIATGINNSATESVCVCGSMLKTLPSVMIEPGSASFIRVSAVEIEPTSESEMPSPST